MGPDQFRPSPESLKSNPFRVEIRNPLGVQQAIAQEYMRESEQLVNVMTGEGRAWDSSEGSIGLGTLFPESGLFSSIKASAEVVTVAGTVNFRVLARYHNPQRDGYWSPEQVRKLQKFLSYKYGNTQDFDFPFAAEPKAYELTVESNDHTMNFFVSLGFETPQDQADAYQASLPDQDYLDEIQHEEDDPIMRGVMEAFGGFLSANPTFSPDPLPKILAGTLGPIEIVLSPDQSLQLSRLRQSEESQDPRLISYLKGPYNKKYAREQGVFVAKLQQFGSFVEFIVRSISQVKGISQSGTLILEPPTETSTK